MVIALVTEEKKINAAIAEEFRVLKGRRHWDNKQILALFRRKGLPIKPDRLSRVLHGKARLTAAELVMLENEGLSLDSVRDLFQKKATHQGGS
jgi:hypothetical protein